MIKITLLILLLAALIVIAVDNYQYFKAMKRIDEQVAKWQQAAERGEEDEQ